MRILFTSLLLIGLTQAQTIDTLIKRSLKAHTSLESIKHRLSAMDEVILKSRKWQNPDLSFSINDMQFGDLSDRSIEPMQYEAINMMQKFPWFGKLDVKERIEQARKHLLLNTYEAAKVALSLEIKNTAYTIKEIQKRIAVVRKYIRLEKQNIELYNDTIATNPMSHADSVTAELSLSKIEVKLEQYLSILNSQREKLTYLTGQKVGRIDDSLKVKRPLALSHYLSRITDNPSYKMKASQERIAAENKTLADLNHIPDPYIKVGYFHRKEFEDYGSVTVGVTAPIYGTEALDSEIARKERLATRSAVLDTKFRLQSEIRSEYVKLKEAYRIYFIIKEKSLPQVEHMLELSADAIQSGADLFTYTNILEQKLFLEEEQIAAAAGYLKTQARLQALTGAL